MGLGLGLEQALWMDGAPLHPSSWFSMSKALFRQSRPISGVLVKVTQVNEVKVVVLL
jgi:hypothetical protein